MFQITEKEPDSTPICPHCGFKPSMETKVFLGTEIIDQLLHKHFSVQVFRCMAESVAAEHAARMTAMENATENANELIHDLTLQYNKARQASITKEILEIIGGAEAIRKAS